MRGPFLKPWPILAIAGGEGRGKGHRKQGVAQRGEPWSVPRRRAQSGRVARGCPTVAKFTSCVAKGRALSVGCELAWHGIAPRNALLYQRGARWGAPRSIRAVGALREGAMAGFFGFPRDLSTRDLSNCASGEAERYMQRGADAPWAMHPGSCIPGVASGTRTGHMQKH